jgi:hypothetical protein
MSGCGFARPGPADTPVPALDAYDCGKRDAIGEKDDRVY